MLERFLLDVVSYSKDFSDASTMSVCVNNTDNWLKQNLASRI